MNVYDGKEEGRKTSPDGWDFVIHRVLVHQFDVVFFFFSLSFFFFPLPCMIMRQRTRDERDKNNKAEASAIIVIAFLHFKRTH